MTLEKWSRDPQEVSRQFLRQLNSSDGNVVEAATRELRNAPPAALMRLLQEEALQQRQAEALVLPYALGVWACVALTVFVTATQVLQRMRHESGVLLIALFYAGMAMAGKWLFVRAARQSGAHSEQAREHLCAAIRANRDPALVFLILEWLDWSGHEGHRTLSQSEPCISFCMALENGLPMFSREEQQGITRRYKSLWPYLLGEAHVPDGLKIILLGLLEEWGTSEAVSAVRSLTYADPDRELTFAASRCLLALQQREAEAKRSSMLLRPSCNNSASPETLLRAAPIQTEDEQPEQLLRASHS